MSSVVHELGRPWGATSEEVRRDMPGDDIVPHPEVLSTTEITIDAAPEQVWPWLLRTVPHGEPGTAFYRVELLEPPRLMVLHSTEHVPTQLKGRMRLDWTWTFELRALDPSSTRLVFRVRGTLPPVPGPSPASARTG
jgi:hypothetical protein